MISAPPIYRVPPAAALRYGAAMCALTLAMTAFAASSSSFGLTSGANAGGAGYATSANFAAYGCMAIGGGNASSASFGLQSGCASLFMSLPADDDDGDGVSNGTEDAAPNGGDANGDGTADSLQSNVASLPGGSGYVTAIVPPGPCASLVSVVPAASPANGADPGFVYPFGRVALTMPCASNGATVTFDLLYFGAAPWPPAAIRGFGPTPPTFGSSNYHGLSATFGTQAVPGVGNVPVAHVTLTDGLTGDDTAADGTISALFGPVTLAVPAGTSTIAVPAMSNPALLALLALALAALGMPARRRRRP